MSINGVDVSFGFAFNLMYPVPFLPVDTTTWPGVYSCADAPNAPIKSLPPVVPSDLVTTRLPLKLVSLPASFNDTLWTFIYSVVNPVELNFFNKIISPASNPLAFATCIVSSSTDIVAEPVMVVSFATCSCPPTAFTLSFSNTVVFNVPRILASSTSKNEPTEPSAISTAPKKNPWVFEAYPCELICPAEFKIKLLEDIKVSVISNPPIWPLLALILPTPLTRKLLELISKFGFNKLSVVPGLPLIKNVFPLVSAESVIVNPPILPPVKWTLEPEITPVEPVITNSLLSENNTPLGVASVVSPILKLPILPPVNNTVEPVICPLSFNLNLSLELDIAFPVNANPPITPSLALTWPVEFIWNPLEDNTKFVFWNPVPECALPLKKKSVVDIALSVMVNPPICPPAVAVMVPCKVTLPSLANKKLLELISKLPSLPLM